MNALKKYFLLSYSLIVAVSVFGQYNVSTLMGGVTSPVAFTFLPDGEIIFTQKAGFIKVFDALTNQTTLFYNLSDSTYNDFERGLLGIEIDPLFENNHYIYCYYVHLLNNAQKLRLVRFTESNGIGILPTIIFNKDLGTSTAINGNHVGGNLRFRPSEPENIYLSIGDVAQSSGGVPGINAQNLTNPFGKILRMRKDGTIPTDNPFYDDGNPATGNNDFIWSYGHRNAFDFAFSAINDSLYISENGLNTWDEINYGIKGANYGWNECEGFMLRNSVSTTCTNPNYKLPLAVWGAPLPAVTGILHYASQTIPELNNHLLVANNDEGEIWDLVLGNAPYFDTVLSKSLLLDLVSGAVATGNSGLTTIKQGPEGCIYALRGGYTSDGKIFKVCPLNIGFNPMTAKPLIGFSPNPANESLKLEFGAEVKNDFSFEINDLLGRKIQYFAVVSKDFTFDISGLEVGSYFGIITLNGQVQTIRFFKS
jgi:glucose/arabinose dehydrogenase